MSALALIVRCAGRDVRFVAASGAIECRVLGRATFPEHCAPSNAWAVRGPVASGVEVAASRGRPKANVPMRRLTSVCSRRRPVR